MMSARAAIVCAFVLLAPAAAGAQQDVGDPVWAKADNFWYRKAVPGGHLWMNVDAKYGVKEPLFDHQRLAIELTIETGEQYTPLTLPFVAPANAFVVKYDGSNAYIPVGAMAVEFVLWGDRWRCDLQTKWNWNLVPPTDYECTARGPLPPVAPGQQAAASTANAPRVSPDGSWEAFVQDHNVAVRRVGGAAGDVTMLSSDGAAGFAYQHGSIQWADDSSSLYAYRVMPAAWLSDAPAGVLKQQIARGEWSVRDTESSRTRR
jgi:hypothetical protein